MPWFRRLVPSLLLLALVAGSAPARGNDAEADSEALEAEWKGVESEALDRLHELARWCGSAKLFATRANVYEAILTLAPDDAEARKWLRYEKQPDGTWKRERGYTPPRNLRKGTDDFVARRAALSSWFLAQATPLLRKAEAAGRARLRARIVQVGLAADPDNETIRGWDHEVRDGQAWVLEESVTARTRRPGLRKTAEDAIQAVPTPEKTGLTAQDQRGQPGWTEALQGDHVRLVGNVDHDELVRILRASEAVWPLFEKAFGSRPPSYPRPGITIYVANSLEVGNRCLAAQPGLSPHDIEFRSRLGGTWLPGRPAILVKSPRPEARLEMAPHQVLLAPNAQVLRLTNRHAWALEALELHLTFQITKTRLVYGVADIQSRYAAGGGSTPDYDKKLDDSSANWLELAGELIDGPDKPDLFLLAGKDVNHLTKHDILYAYAIVAWVVEGHEAEAAKAFFRTLTGPKGNDLDQVCLDSFGFAAHTMEKRVRRWLDETAKIPER